MLRLDLIKGENRGLSRTMEGGEDEGETPSNQERPPSYRAEGNTANPRQVGTRDEGRKPIGAVGGASSLPQFSPL